MTGSGLEASLRSVRSAIAGLTFAVLAIPWFTDGSDEIGLLISLLAVLLLVYAFFQR